MKKILIVMFILSLAVSGFAIPFASQITLSDTTPIIGKGCSISYFINQAGGTATIYIVDKASSSIVATFPGTAGLGANSVVWDGTDDNSDGADVPEGEYRVKIKVEATAAAGWVEIASNSSLGNYIPVGWPTIYQTLFDGYSGSEIYISQNPDDDSFGYVLSSQSYSNPVLVGQIVFNPDLSCYDGADGQNVWLQSPVARYGNQDMWGSCVDPDDSDYLWICGQNAATPPSSVFYGKWNSAFATDATNGVTALTNARDIAVAKQGADKYAYVALGLAQVIKVKIEGAKISSIDTPVNVLGGSIAGYSKGVNLDADGNLYWTCRYTDSSSGDGGVIYRWDKSVIDAASSEGSLTEANASWEVFMPVDASNTEGIAITPSGDVYACCVNEDALANNGDRRGIYYLGNVSQATNKKTLTVSDRVYAFYGTDFASTMSGYGISLTSDIAGNLYFSDRADEQIRAVGPEGASSIEAFAPLSQSLDIQPLPTSAQNWALYE